MSTDRTPRSTLPGPCQVVAELSINHGGDPALAAEMIHAAKEAGCDGVKLQTYRTADFLPPVHPDWEMFERAEIWPHLEELVKVAHDLGLRIGTTPTSLEGIKEAVAAGVDFLKNGSDFLLRTDLIEEMISTGLPTWVSCGMASEAEIESVPDGAALMLCTSLYPCPDEDAHLARLTEWPFYDGFSDHTVGSLAAGIAAYEGVEMVEKHFRITDDCPDALWAATPAVMAEVVETVRRCEALRGSVRAGFVLGEAEGRDAWRVTGERLRA